MVNKQASSTTAGSSRCVAWAAARHRQLSAHRFKGLPAALTVGAEAILDGGFEQAREDFCRQNCHHFEVKGVAFRGLG